MTAPPDPAFLLRGLAIGFSIAAPVGPIGVLCLRRTFAYGRLSGFVSGLGAATADAMYGAVAGFGLTAVSHLLLSYQLWLRTVGGLFLVYLGIRTMLSRPAEKAAEAPDKGLLWDYASTFALTLTNPITIISYAAVFAGLGVAGTGASHVRAAFLVLGVFLGSSLWWFLLSGAVGLSRRWVSTRALRAINVGSGLVITGFGAAALAGLL
jgi:threonine/homoserine/homoserine lactone efflux protein